MSIVPLNRLKHALRQGQTAVGLILVEIRQPSVMQLLANAGFEFVIIDNEHGPFNLETIADLSRTAKQVGLTPLVRSPDTLYPYITQPLDAGAQGLMIPRITTAEQVREVVQKMKYPPLGVRGNALALGYMDFKSGPVGEVMAQVNEETLLVVQVETRAAVENIDEIVSVPGVDVALIGPNDLSISLGVAGQIDSPPMRAAIQKTIDACRRHNVTPAIHMNDLDLAVYWAKHGMQMISSHAETRLLMKAGLEVTQTIRQAWQD